MNKINSVKKDIYLPNKIINAIIANHLSGYEYRVLLYLMSQLYDSIPRKKFKKIKQLEIANLLGIQKTHISRTIKYLIEKNIVLRNNNLYSIQENTAFWKWNKNK